jgi:hypothetical protein
VFDKEYSDGGTYYNEQRESNGENGITVNKLIRAHKNGIAFFPDNLANFEECCAMNAVMCCFVQDRQAGYQNGDCATPYDENRLNANPADNTDICNVDMSRAPTSSRTAS